MTAFHRCPIPKHRLAWALWLALLLPLAQYAAAWHALSHTEFDAASASAGKQAPHLTHCDLCLTAAAVSGGAPLIEPGRLALAALAHGSPQAAAPSAWIAAPALPYRSRAPPSSPS